MRIPQGADDARSPAPLGTAARESREGGPGPPPGCHSKVMALLGLNGPLSLSLPGWGSPVQGCIPPQLIQTGKLALHPALRGPHTGDSGTSGMRNPGPTRTC